MQQPRILFFIDGPVPSKTDIQASNLLRGKGVDILFRNSRFVGDASDGAPEPADGVAGEVIPKPYAGYLTADVVIAKYQTWLTGTIEAQAPLSGQLASGAPTGTPATPVVAAGGFQPATGFQPPATGPATP